MSKISPNYEKGIDFELESMRQVIMNAFSDKLLSLDVDIQQHVEA